MSAIVLHCGVFVLEYMNDEEITWEIYYAEGSGFHYIKHYGMSMTMNKFQLFKI